jgi:hypothetical protein
MSDPRADLTLYIGRNVERMLQLHDARRPFCWPGFLFPQAWFLYRKMYLWAALASAGPFLIAYFPPLARLSWGFSFLGAMGLRLYFASARATVERIRAANTPEEASALIERAGGVSLIGAVIGVVFAFAAFVLTLKAGGHRGSASR